MFHYRGVQIIICIKPNIYIEVCQLKPLFSFI